MNRDIHQAGTSQKHHAIHQQTQALYALLGRIRAAFQMSLLKAVRREGAVLILEYSRMFLGFGLRTPTMHLIAFAYSVASYQRFHPN